MYRYGGRDKGSVSVSVLCMCTHSESFIILCRFVQRSNKNPNIISLVKNSVHLCIHIYQCTSPSSQA